MSTTSSSFSSSLSLRQLSRTFVCFAIIITIMNFMILGVIFSHESSSSVSSSSPIQQQQHNTNPMMMMRMVKQRYHNNIPGDGLHHDGEEHDEIAKEEGEEKHRHEKKYGGIDDVNSRRINENNNNNNNNNRRGNNININSRRHDRDTLNRTQQQHQQKHVYDKQLPILEDDEEESMSACLLTMDDNHFLIEWIAYHYYVCRLRHLIVAIDPRSSRVLPTEIFDRWSDFGLIIEVWDNPDKYLFEDYEERIVKRGQKNWDMEPFSDPQLSRHRERQSEFYFLCIKSLKRQNLGWALLIDTDEYTYVNPAIKDPNNHDLYLEKWSKLPTISQEGSVLQMLLGLKFPSTKYSLDFPCVPLNRRQFSSREIEQEEANDDDEKQQRQQQLLNNINLTQNQFQTLQYMLWGWFDKYHPKLAGKAVIDLKRLRLEDIDHPANKGRIDPHQPLKTICPSENVFLSERHTLLIVNHYMGSRKQWESRNNDARGLACLSKLYDHQNNILGEHTLTKDDDISPWLTGFVDYVGIANATKLLKDIGVVAPLIQSTDKTSTKNNEDDHHNQKKRKATTTNSTNIVNMYELVSKIAPIGLQVHVMEDNDDDDDETEAEERWEPDVGTIIASNCRGGYDIKFNTSTMTWVWAYGLPYIKRAYNNSQDLTLYDEVKSIFDLRQ